MYSKRRSIRVPLSGFRPVFFLQSKRGVYRCLKITRAPLRKMTELRRFAFGNSARGLNQLIIPQNMKRRPIKSFRLAIAPMPQRTQYCRFPSANQSGTANSPRLFRVALAVDRRRHNSALTGLLKPSKSAALD